ncbi:MAG: protein-L-isoaspartate(D-aspartate) O-methyltransferase [Pirellulales bacterium]|nr:protein-L-isoaspartate(D-aspartate) O-methyltransferase [Pirellulales bacterium]
MQGRHAHRAVSAIAAAIALSMLGLAFFFSRRASKQEPAPAVGPAVEKSADKKPAEDARFVRARERMVERDLAGRHITNQRVLDVMGRLPRQRFVPARLEKSAYDDHPLPIGHNQTISQPYIVALMTQLADPKPGDRALDVGTGSGYQAAVLASLCKEVYGIEIVKPLADDARARLKQLGFQNVTVRHGDGYQGWADHAPFDVILVAAAPDHVPQPLIDQLAVGGRLVIPVGRYLQELLLLEKQSDGSIRRSVKAGVAFVPMTGQAQRNETLD